MKTSVLRVLASAMVLGIATLGSAQPDTAPEARPVAFEKPAPKPFRILTAGRRITVQSKKDINKILVWTASGHRFIEDENVNASSYSFSVTINEKFFFVMLELKDGKRYTEKIGVQ